MIDYAIKLVEDTKRGPIAVLKNDSHMSKWCESAGSIVHDQTVPLHILPLFKEGDTVVDVGANIGTHTVAYAERVGPTGKVVAFEPYLPSFVCLAVNCRDLTQVELYNCALSDIDRSASVIFPSDTNMGTVSFGKIIDAPIRSVAVTTLDSFCLEACSFIKIDVEGMEVDVLAGAMQTIRKHKPVIYVELNDAALRNHSYVKQDVVEGLVAMGYDYEFTNPTHSLSLPQVDVIMRPK